MKKILLIEDEKILSDLYEDALIKEGFKVFTASDPEEGMILAKKERPGLIILDILLPKENGIDFLKKLRKESDISSTAVVAFSNYDDPKTKKMAKKLDAKAYLIKTNYTPQEIIEKIKTYLAV